MTTFAALLRRHREARRWNQERLACEAGINNSLISMLESEVRRPTRQSTAKLCAGLGLAPTEAVEMWFAAGLLPPNLDAELLARLVALVREARAPSDGQHAA